MSELLFVTAQPDLPYFHWQCLLYGHNFLENKINPNQIHIIFGMVNGNTEPSEEALKLRDFGFNVHFYLDERDQKHYIPKALMDLTSKS